MNSPAHDDEPKSDDDDQSSGEVCPVCQQYNSPPAGDKCEHNVARTWDGQVEPTGAGQRFAAEWSALSGLACAADEGSTEGIVLQAQARRSPLRAELIGLAGQELPLIDALQRLLHAIQGCGWSTGGVLCGGGHSWYVRDPIRLDDLTAQCRAICQAFGDLKIEVGEGGTEGLDLEAMDEALNWELAVSGRWEENYWHNGYIAYNVASLGGGRWLMQSVERNGELDGITQEDVDEGRLNDDQIQAMWGMTLEEAQAEEFRQIIAACSGASSESDSTEIAELLYQAVVHEGGKEISESDGSGLLEI